MAIDPVRVISNQSTGELGHFITEAVLKANAQVTLFEGPVTHQLNLNSKRLRIVKFNFFEELEQNLRKALTKKYAAVIHLAAVSDYKIASPAPYKLKSDKHSLTLKLTRTPKLIEAIKKINSEIFLVGFKLEMDLTETQIKKETASLIERAGCDLVVANRLDPYTAYIVDQNKNLVAKANTRRQLAAELVKQLITRL